MCTRLRLSDGNSHASEPAGSNTHGLAAGDGRSDSVVPSTCGHSCTSLSALSCVNATLGALRQAAVDDERARTGPREISDGTSDATGEVNVQQEPSREPPRLGRP
jgi:hypothetical protein